MLQLVSSVDVTCNLDPLKPQSHVSTDVNADMVMALSLTYVIEIALDLWSEKNGKLWCHRERGGAAAASEAYACDHRQ